jgi:hypothetical protein
MGLVLLILLVLVIVGGLPTWRHSKDWGYAPSGGAGVLLVILIVLLAVNVVPRGF